LLELNFHGVKVRAHLCLAGCRSIVPEFRLGEIAPGLRERFIGLGELHLIVAIVELREQLAGLHGVALVNEDAPDNSALDGAYDPAFGRHDGGVRANA
jgi:hypothetical protein